MTCSKCQRKIEIGEDFLVQDKTGARFCQECGEHYYDVTTVRMSCSCSRGGNASTCECREVKDALDAEIREAEGLVAWATDPAAARAYLAELKQRRKQVA